MNPTLVITNQSLVPRTCPQGGARHGIGGLIPTKRWFSPPNTFRYIPGWEGLRATTVVQPTINLKSWRRPIGLRVLRHDVEERHSSRSVYNANHEWTASPAHTEVCTRSSVSSASRFLSVRCIFSWNGSSVRKYPVDLAFYRKINSRPRPISFSASTKCSIHTLMNFFKCYCSRKFEIYSRLNVIASTLLE